MGKPILCVDFDGVIHSYTSGWIGATVIPDPPVPGALEWLRKASEHFDVVIYSSRSKSEDGIQAMRLWFGRQRAVSFNMDNPMNNWFPITFAHEKPAAFLTIDDRAICFDGDWSKLDPVALLKFRPWYAKEAYEGSMDTKTVKQGLWAAREEIVSLRRDNQILAAKCEVLEIFKRILVPDTGGLVHPDPLSYVEQALKELEEDRKVDERAT